MAQQIVTNAYCDWHGQLPDPLKVRATQLRINPAGKENDLCDPCAIIFDIAAPRMELMIQLFHPEVVERLCRIGREPADTKSERRAGQLAIPGTSPAPKEVAKKTTAKAATDTAAATRKAALQNRGRWDPDVPQVRCPLPHTGRDSPKEYWVAVSNRGSHAKQSHRLLGPQVAYELPTDGSVKYGVSCNDHEVCAKAGGYGFKNSSGLTLHKRKADEEGWAKAPSADATETESPASNAA
ncbi:hypothetical protein [Streptomyces sp. Midd1]|uniref:hypothetical protein n=1 Tax=Streptomyces sp. Midd3 TaxID=3161191 RepID=UPI0034DB05C0